MACKKMVFFPLHVYFNVIYILSTSHYISFCSLLTLSFKDEKKSQQLSMSVRHCQRFWKNKKRKNCLINLGLVIRNLLYFTTGLSFSFY